MTEEKKGKIMNLKLLWYCTKAKGKNYYLRKLENGKYRLGRDKGDSLNGKIVAESDFEVEKVYFHQDCGFTHKLCETKLLKHSCLSYEQLEDYLHGYGGYAIHIKNLEIFDKPKKLIYFYKRTEKVNPDIICSLCTNYPFDKCKECRDNYDYFNLKRAPQNMMYVYDYLGDKYVLISIRPEWACKILNGEKTIEVRKQVLNCMKGN